MQNYLCELRSYLIQYIESKEKYQEIALYYKDG